MNPESNPFSPDEPVPAGAFVGRKAEITTLRSIVRRSTRGIVGVGFVTGERGIGKSSLASFVRHLAEQADGVVGCHVYLGGVDSVADMLSRVFERLVEESTDKPWYKQLVRFLDNRIKRVGLFGTTLELDISKREFEAFARNFVPSMRKPLNELPEPKRTVLIVLDDINGLAKSTEFANWLKSTVDEFATSGTDNRLCLLAVGLEDRRQELIASQPSLARVFQLINLAPWTDQEVSEFFRRRFEEGQAVVTDDGLAELVRFTGGMPVLAHEIGHAVWREASSERITRNDCIVAITTAAKVVGTKLLEPSIFREIQSTLYHSILRHILGSGPTRRFTRADVIKMLPPEERDVLDNFLQRMKQLGAIASDPEIRGGYQFANELYSPAFFLEVHRRVVEEGKRATRSR